MNAIGTLHWIELFEKAKAELDKNGHVLDPVFEKAEREAIDSQLESLRADLKVQ